jgi:septation ring formation regulator EzrA
MVITLDNGQTVTIYEDNNLLKQIEPYIDKEIYDLLYDEFDGADKVVIENESLAENLTDANEYIDELQEKYDRLDNDYDDLYEENKELENQNSKILSQIKEIVDLSRSNKLAFHEVENKLEEIWEGN